MYEWQRTGLDAQQTVAHELKMQKIQSQGYESLTDAQVREYEIENALIAATGVLQAVGILMESGKAE